VDKVEGGNCLLGGCHHANQEHPELHYFVGIGGSTFNRVENSMAFAFMIFIEILQISVSTREESVSQQGKKDTLDCQLTSCNYQ